MNNLNDIEKRNLLAKLDDSCIISEEEAAVFLATNKRILQDLRRKEKGPPFSRLGINAIAKNQKVTYKIKDIKKWLEERTFSNNREQYLYKRNLTSFCSLPVPFFTTLDNNYLDCVLNDQEGFESHFLNYLNKKVKVVEITSLEALKQTWVQPDNQNKLLLEFKELTQKEIQDVEIMVNRNSLNLTIAEGKEIKQSKKSI